VRISSVRARPGEWSGASHPERILADKAQTQQLPALQGEGGVGWALFGLVEIGGFVEQIQRGGIIVVTAVFTTVCITVGAAVSTAVCTAVFGHGGTRVRPPYLTSCWVAAVLDVVLGPVLPQHRDRREELDVDRPRLGGGGGRHIT
jgi:hypothetical protein